MNRLLTLIFLPCLAACASTSNTPVADDWDSGANRSPESATLHSMARIYVAQGQDSQAEAALREILAEDPDFVPAYEELARLYVRRNLLDGAVAALQLGLQQHGNDPILLNDMGMCRLLQKDHASAAAYFTRAAALTPDDARPRANLALALALQGRDEEALALWQQIVPPDEAAKNLDIARAGR
jgi:Flp pilus assembly protein TadD